MRARLTHCCVYFLQQIKKTSYVRYDGFMRLIDGELTQSYTLLGHVREMEFKYHYLDVLKDLIRSLMVVSVEAKILTQKQLRIFVQPSENSSKRSQIPLVTLL